jgi:hypothetical protein
LSLTILIPLQILIRVVPDWPRTLVVYIRPLPITALLLCFLHDMASELLA